jgi:hypothetical protein
MLQNKYFAIPILVVLSACGAIKPEPPDKKNALLAQKPIPKVLSTIDLPLEVDLSPYFKLADSTVDKTFEGGEQPACQGFKYEYKMNRGPLKIDGKGGNNLGIAIDLNYAVKGDYCALCIGNSCTVPSVGLSIGYGEPMKRASVAMESTIDLLPNYKLKTVSKLTELKAVDPIKVAFGVDVTQTVLTRARPYLNDALKMVDKEVGKLDLKAMIEPAFMEMQKGISLNGMGFLYLNPEQLSISPLTLQKNKLKANIGIKASPEVRTEAVDNKIKKLPNLTEYQKVNGFSVYTDIRMHYDTLEKQIMGYLAGQKFTSGSQYIIIKDLALFAVEERLGVEVDFEGSKKGRLFLTGLPVYDSATQRIRVDDLQFDLKTKNILLKSAKWLLNDKIRKEMQKAMNVDVSPYLKDAKKKMNEALNAKYDHGLTLKGTINSLNITDHQMRAEELWVRVFMGGSIHVKL